MSFQYKTRTWPVFDLVFVRNKSKLIKYTSSIAEDTHSHSYLLTRVLNFHRNAYDSKQTLSHCLLEISELNKTSLIRHVTATLNPPCSLPTQLQHQEVDACVWLTRELVEVVVYGSSRRPSEPIPITLVNTTGGRCRDVVFLVLFWFLFAKETGSSFV